MQFNVTREMEDVLEELNTSIFRVAVGVYAGAIFLLMMCIARCRWNRAWTVCLKKIDRSYAMS
jgi:hypothetical protein